MSDDGARLLRHMQAAGFQPEGVRGAFGLDFVGELPAPEGERLFARIRFARKSDGVVEPWPSGVVITRQQHIPVDAAALEAAVPEAALTPLLSALEPFLGRPAPAVTPETGTRVCASCSMRVSEWVVRDGPTCLYCLP